MKKLLILQLTETSGFSLRNSCVNHLNAPFLSAYIKDASREHSKTLETEVFPFKYANLAGDGFIINNVTQIQPDYIWLPNYSEQNAGRLNYIIGKLKKTLPELKIIAQGPEIPMKPTEGQYSDLIDIGIISPDVSVNNKIFNFLSAKNGDINKIDGIILNDSVSKNRVIGKGGRSPSLCGLNESYLSSIPLGKNVWIETKRSCYTRCSFCHFGSFSKAKDISMLDDDVVKKMLEFLRDKWVTDIFFIDPTFNIPIKQSKTVLNLIKKIFVNRTVNFYANIRPEFVDEDYAKMLKDCNFKLLYVGLQSVNPLALWEIGRKTDINRWIKGVNLLRKWGFELNVDVIIGLPGDTPNGFNDTMNFLIQEGLSFSTKCFVLYIPPLSRLYCEHKKYGILFQENPPHLVLKSNTFKFDDIKSGIISAKNNGLDVLLLPFMKNPPPLFIRDKKLYNPQNPINKIVFNGKFEADSIKNRAAMLARTVDLWFCPGENGVDIEGVCNVTQCLSKPNPHTVWNVILQADGEFDIDSIDKIDRSISFLPDIIDYQAIFHSNNYENRYFRFARRFYLISEDRDTLNKLMGANKRTDVLFYLIIKNADDVNEILNSPIDGILVELSENLDAQSLKSFMQIVSALNFRKKDVQFTGLSHQNIWERQYNRVLGAIGEDENILVVE